MSELLQKTKQDNIFNILTGLVIIAILTLAVFFITIFQFPYHPINPYPPATVPAVLVIPSATNTPLQLVTTASQNTNVPVEPSETLEPTVVTKTPTATHTLRPTQTETITPATIYRYQIQGEPAAIAAFIFNPDRNNCSWMGVAGQVHDMQDRPVTGILVLLGGNLEGNTQNAVTMTGTALNYGPAGFEFELADHLVATENKLWIQLVDQSYIPLSGKIFFDTFEDEACEKNLIVINFKQVR